jgi:hypothetical protein
VFDFTYYPLHIQDSQEKTDLPGLIVSPSPRRAARGRSGDQLILLVSLAGSSPLAADPLKQLASRLAETYFQTPGSVTAAMRAVGDALNQFLLDRNLRSTGSGRQSAGMLNLAVIRGDDLFLAHGGPAFTGLIDVTGERRFQDAAGSRGLGLSRSNPLRFYQATIQHGSWLILSPEPTPIWAEASPAGANPSTGSLPNADLLRQHLLILNPAQVRATLVQFQTGNGKAVPGRFSSSYIPLPAVQLPAAPMPTAPLPEVQLTATEPLQLTGLESAEAGPPRPGLDLPGQAGDGIPSKPAADPSAGSTGDTPKRSRGERPSGRPSAPPPEDPRPGGRGSRPSAGGPASREPRNGSGFRPLGGVNQAAAGAAAPAPRGAAVPVLRFLSSSLSKIRHTREGASRGLGGFLANLLPGQGGQPTSLSPLTMAFIALAVPLVVVVASLMVYFERGREQQFQVYYSQAVEAALQTQDQTDPAVLREAWLSALGYLDKADANRPNKEESRALRLQAQSGLDELELVVRLNFQPAIRGDLAATVNVVDMVASSADLYLLDATLGKVIRSVITGQGYEVDADFRCEPGPSGSFIVGRLVDLAPMPRGNDFKASIVAVDAEGNALFCVPGGVPTSIPMGLPANGWGSIDAIALDANTLYVLDPQNNAVWEYAGLNSVREEPGLFFSNGDTPNLSSAIDLAVNGEDMYILHADGHLTLCTVTYTGGYTTRCTEPAPLSDPRPGRQSNPTTLPGTAFSHLLFTSPPDPSVYVLEPGSQSIYHFSLRLNLQRQLRLPSTSDTIYPAGAATAFAIGPNRMAFLAFGSKVYYGLIP